MQAAILIVHGYMAFRCEKLKDIKTRTCHSNELEFDE